MPRTVCTVPSTNINPTEVLKSICYNEVRILKKSHTSLCCDFICITKKFTMTKLEGSQVSDGFVTFMFYFSVLVMSKEQQIVSKDCIQNIVNNKASPYAKIDFFKQTKSANPLVLYCVFGLVGFAGCRVVPGTI